MDRRFCAVGQGQCVAAIIVPFGRAPYEICLLSYLRAALCAQVPSSVKDKSQFG
jgi:hypothetical protein